MNATWNVGRISRLSKRGKFYESERSETWTGGFGLISPSDYGYATSSTNTRCDTEILDSYNYPKECSQNNWLSTGKEYWTINSQVTHAGTVYTVSSGGYIGERESYCSGCSSGNGANWGKYIDNYVYPSVYLKSTVNIKSGTGTSSDPFILTQ